MSPLFLSLSDGPYVIAVSWAGVSLPGQSVSSDADNILRASRDTVADPLSPDDFRYFRLLILGNI